ncbi:MAG TPA: hypothetical protein VEY30_12430, partial [Myxococcaceae bacterium]|nr:hypothetical protein [Myxococcaceae bacterium]
YVPLLPFGPQLRTTAKGREVRAIYPPKPFTILDFAGITQVSNAFLNTLLQPARDTPWPTEFQPIHASAAVRAALALRRWRGDLAAGNTQPLEVDGTDFYDAG